MINGFPTVYLLQAALTETATLRQKLDWLPTPTDPLRPSPGLAEQLDALSDLVRRAEAEWAAGQRAGDCNTETELRSAAGDAQVRRRDSWLNGHIWR